MTCELDRPQTLLSADNKVLTLTLTYHPGRTQRVIVSRSPGEDPADEMDNLEKTTLLSADCKVSFEEDTI